VKIHLTVLFHESHEEIVSFDPLFEGIANFSYEQTAAVDSIPWGQRHGIHERVESVCVIRTQ